ETDDDNEEEGEAEEYYYSPAAAATYLAVPLSILMFGLDILCHQQYSQEPVYKDIFLKCLRGFPVLFLLTYLFHPRKDNRLAQLAAFVASVAAGVWMVKATNQYGYFRVMK